MTLSYATPFGYIYLNDKVGIESVAASLVGLLLLIMSSSYPDAIDRISQLHLTRFIWNSEDAC